MHALKLALLLLLTLACMRAASWFFGWLLSLAFKGSAGWTSLVSNGICLGVFAGLLCLSLMPGETMDYAALVFGAVVYALYLGMDLKWRPWRAKGKVKHRGPQAV